MADSCVCFISPWLCKLPTAVLDIVYEDVLTGNDATLWLDDCYWDKGIKWGSVNDLLTEKGLSENTKYVKKRCSSI